ncbi:DUF1611 domain-containing protein [Celeribacter persicus]|jgi:hypothetical protein|uniref:DUF1611 domain-containing protein n=1 Tax=Celeribacter persicus TaxID=1651082 RepID=A0A2T5HSU0_9RHOB|nr:DUF1611 domain-containing protein [Celeribacter persicus]PTQ74606.1 hypothetical protein C8N42_104251 [Celeribacter persicus]
MTTALTSQLDSAKWSFSTRRVDRTQICDLDTRFAEARAGDLILAQVDQIGQHRRIQLPSGRPSDLFPGDLVVLACGARYAPDQFEGIAEIAPDGADMLAGGGCIGRMTARNERIKPATRLLPKGRLLGQNGVPVNLSQFALPDPARPSEIPVIAVLGTAMNSGKTLATAQLALGLRRAGWKTAAIKATGTGAFGDYNEYSDTGAHYVGDFTDAGMVTTYLEELPRIRNGIDRLLGEAQRRDCEIAVMEVADGLFQRETAQLIADPWFQSRISGLVFACGDAVAAAGGVAELARLGLAPDLLTGMLSCSPMASREAETATGIPVLRKSDLSDPAEANGFALQAGADWSRAA